MGGFGKNACLHLKLAPPLRWGAPGAVSLSRRRLGGLGAGGRVARMGGRSGKKAFVIGNVAVLGFWAVMIGLLVEKTYIRETRRPSSLAYLSPLQLDEVSLASGEQWMGIYMRGEKVGYVHAATVPIEGGYRLSEQSYMKLVTMGVPQHMLMDTRCAVDTAFSLRSFYFRLVSEAMRLELTGEVRGNNIQLWVTTAGETQQSTIRLSEPPHLWLNLKSRLASQHLKEGETYTYMLFDPQTMTNAPMTLTVLAREKITVAGTERTAYKVRERFQGIEAVAWLGEGGETFREESPFGLTLVQEPKEVAVAVRGALPTEDIIEATAVLADVEIERPRQTRLLTMRLARVPLGGFALDGGRQSLAGDVVTVRREGVPDSAPYRLPCSAKELAEYMAPTHLLQSDHEKIREAARRIVGEEEDPIEATRLLREWVFREVRKEPTVSIPSALEVLQRRAGDCNEHSTLFVALARAVGIPARIAVGLIYSSGAFYYHAWAEVFLGEWVSVDALLNQLPADATHVKFVEGGVDKHVQLVKLIGQLEVEVKEYR